MASENEHLVLRTVVLSRPLKGKTTDHYTFAPQAAGVPFISAVGSTPAFSIHKAKAGATLMLVEVGAPMCVCHEGKTGTIDGVPFSRQKTKTQHDPLDTCATQTLGGV